MNILLLHQYYLEDDDAGGSRWNEMTKMWTEEGHHVEVIAGMVHPNGESKRPEYKGKYFFRKKNEQVNIIRCHVSEAYNRNFLGRLWGYFSFVFSSLFAGVFKLSKRPDLVLVTSPPLFIGISGYVISRINKVPLVFEVRDLWPESAIDTGVVKNKLIISLSYWLESFLYSRSSLINVLTPAFEEALLNVKKVPRAKLIMIPNAADFSLSSELLENFDAVSFRQKLNLDDKFVITYVGAHGVANDLGQILDTAKLLEDTNVEFLLIGEGMEKERLQIRAKQLNLNNVRFINGVPKKEVFKFILASEMGTSVLKRVETFKTVYSNKTFDYMACRKPILMAIDGVSRKLVEDAGAGTFVEPERPEYFAAIIREYLAHPERLQLEGESGYRFAHANFDRRVLGKRYLEEIIKRMN